MPMTKAVQLKDLPTLVCLEALEAFHAGRAEAPLIALADRWPEKIIELKLEKLAARGLIEYGVSARTGWLTSEGREKLRRLRIPAPRP